MAEWTSLLTAIGGLVGTLVWPAVVVVIVYMLRGPISSLLNSDDVSFSGPGGLSLTAKRKVAQAADATVDASKARGEEPLGRKQALAEAAETQRQLAGIDDPVVLWVDDRPSNNVHERSAMEALGIRFVLSTSTEDALEKIRRTTFDAIISDMGRPPDARAGYTLLDRLRGDGNRTPFVIYASSRAAEHFDEAVAHGAVGCTNRPNELIHMVVDAVKIARRR